MVAGAVANATYYGLAPLVMRWVMPWFATVALPAALGLFASEFGAETLRAERRLRAERAAQIAAEPVVEVADTPQVPARSWACESCGRSFGSRNGLNAHMRVHVVRRGRRAAGGRSHAERGNGEDGDGGGVGAD